VGWEKVACWSKKPAIPLKRVKAEKKVLWRAYKKSQTLFRTVPSPSRRLGVRNPTPKLQSLLSQELLKIGTSYLAGIFTGSIQTQAREKILEKREWGRIHRRPNFLVPPIISGTRRPKATNFKVGRYVHRVHPSKSPLKVGEKRECGRIHGLSKFFGVPPIISGTGKATNFKFGRSIHRVHPNKSTLESIGPLTKR